MKTSCEGHGNLLHISAIIVHNGKLNFLNMFLYD
jgi:hypothetical protein